MRDSLTPEQPPSGPLYARESASDPRDGTERGEGGDSGPQTGAEGFVPGWAPHMDAYAKNFPRPTPEPELREQIAEALMAWAERNNAPQYAAMRRPDTVRQNAYSRADAVLAVPAIQQLQATVARVRDECNRIEAAVRANPQDPDFDGAYLAAIGHVRRALNPPQEQR